MSICEKMREREIIRKQIEKMENLEKYVARGYAFDERAIMPDNDEEEKTEEREKINHTEFLVRMGFVR